MDQLICASLSHTHYWYEVGMLKVPAVYIEERLNEGPRLQCIYCRPVMCVCVFFLFILDIKFVGRTSRGHTGFLIHLLSAVRALIFLARRIQPFLSLVDREVEFCALNNDLIVLHPLGIFIFVF